MSESCNCPREFGSNCECQVCDTDMKDGGFVDCKNCKNYKYTSHEDEY